MVLLARSEGGSSASALVSISSAVRESPRKRASRAERSFLAAPTERFSMCDSAISASPRSRARSAAVSRSDSSSLSPTACSIKTAAAALSCSVMLGRCSASHSESGSPECKRWWPSILRALTPSREAHLRAASECSVAVCSSDHEPRLTLRIRWCGSTMSPLHLRIAESSNSSVPSPSNISWVSSANGARQSSSREPIPPSLRRRMTVASTYS